MNDEKQIDRRGVGMTDAEVQASIDAIIAEWEENPIKARPLSDADRKRWDELRAQGIITDGNSAGPCRPWQPKGRPRASGVLARFLRERWGE